MKKIPNEWSVYIADRTRHNQDYALHKPYRGSMYGSYSGTIYYISRKTGIPASTLRRAAKKILHGDPMAILSINSKKHPDWEITIKLDMITFIHNSKLSSGFGYSTATFMGAY